MLSLESQHVFPNFLFLCVSNHLMTGPLGNSELRFSGSKMHCPHRDQSLRVLIHDGSPNFFFLLYGDTYAVTQSITLPLSYQSVKRE